MSVFFLWISMLFNSYVINMYIHMYVYVKFKITSFVIFAFMAFNNTIKCIISTVYCNMYFSLTFLSSLLLIVVLLSIRWHFFYRFTCHFLSFLSTCHFWYLFSIYLSFLTFMSTSHFWFFSLDVFDDLLFFI